MHDGLKECPFCGGEAQIMEYDNGFMPGCEHLCTCVIADHKLLDDVSEDFAAQAWNSRVERTCSLVREEDSCDELYPSYVYTCTACDYEYRGQEHEYCPHCGAKVVNAFPERAWKGGL